MSTLSAARGVLDSFKEKKDRREKRKARAAQDEDDEDSAFFKYLATQTRKVLHLFQISQNVLKFTLLLPPHTIQGSSLTVTLLFQL